MKSSRILAAIVLILTLILAIGGYTVYNSLFPMAEQMYIPPLEEILSVSVSPDGETEAVVQDAAALLALLADAEPTRIMSASDYPTVKVYYTVTAAVSARIHRYYIYEKDAQVYVEIPYEGIWRADKQLLEFVENPI